MKYAILYTIALILLASQLMGFPVIIFAVLLTLIASLLSTIDSKNEIQENRNASNARIGEMENKINIVFQKLNEMNSNAQKNVFALETRIDEVKTDYRLELETQYRDLAKKIIDVENRLIEIRKTIGAAFGSLEDRIENR